MVGLADAVIELLEHDQARVDFIHRKIARAATKGVSLPAQRGISLSTGNYVVSVGRRPET
jgi:hypothetical protein